MKTNNGPVSTPRGEARRSTRSIVILPAIVSAVLVLAIIPAAMLAVSRTRRRAARNARGEPESEAEPNAAGEEPHPTWREAYVDAMREMPGTA